MSEHCDSCEYKNKKEICKTGLGCRMKEAEKEVSFDEWFRSEKFNDGFDCNQVTSAKLAWDFREQQISSLKKENIELKENGQANENTIEKLNEENKKLKRLNENLSSAIKKQRVLVDSAFNGESVLSIKEEVQNLKKELEKNADREKAVIEFCLDLQIFVKDFFAERGEILAFQQIRKMTYTHAVRDRARSPTWGESDYLVENFKKIDDEDTRLKKELEELKNRDINRMFSKAMSRLTEVEKIARDAIEKLGFYSGGENSDIELDAFDWFKCKCGTTASKEINTDKMCEVSREFLARDDVKKFLEGEGK